MHAFLQANYKKVMKVKEAMNMSVKEWNDMIRETGLAATWEAEGEARGEARGKALGKAEGEALAKLKVARKLIAKGWKADEVAETVGLSMKKVKPLYNNT
jgi:predicted transposase/invertase (TIGR01784 family)